MKLSDNFLKTRFENFIIIMNAKELNLGHQYRFEQNNKSISFFKNHGVYVVCGFCNYSDNTFAGFYETFETFATAKKYFNNNTKNS